MVYIKFTYFNKKYLMLRLQSYGMPISFKYDLFRGRVSLSEGNIILSNLVIHDMNITGEDFTDITKIELFDTKSNLFHELNFTSYEISKYIENEAITVILSVNNIFLSYNEFTLYMKMITISRSPLILDCRFNTPTYCNLKCPYCSNNNNIKAFRMDFNYESARYYIQTILDIVDNFYYNEPKRFRFCGGETYMFWDKYLEIEKFSRTFKINNIIGYLGITNGIANMDKLLEWIKYSNKEERYKKFELHFSNETLRLENNTKLNTKELLDKWKENVIMFGKEFKDYDNINLCVEIFHKSLQEDLELINFAKNNNFKTYGVSHDQTILNYDYLKSSAELFNKEIFNKVEGIKRRDRNLVNGLTTRFSIYDEDEISFEMKITYDIIDNPNISYNIMYYLF